MSTKKGRFTLDSVEPVQYLPDLPKIVEMWLNREDRAYSIVILLAQFSNCQRIAVEALQRSFNRHPNGVDIKTHWSSSQAVQWVGKVHCNTFVSR